MRSRLRILFTLLGLGVFSVSASAIPVRWTLTGVTFSDGGTASGSFIYDADTNTYSNISITTTAGTVLLTGATYGFIAPVVPPSSLGFLTTQQNGGDLTGTRGMAPFFGTALTNAGGSASVSAVEATCSDAVCTSPVPPSRGTTAGTVTGAQVAPIPTLSFSMLALLGLALAAAALSLIRRR